MLKAGHGQGKRKEKDGEKAGVEQVRIRKGRARETEKAEREELQGDGQMYNKKSERKG